MHPVKYAGTIGNCRELEVYPNYIDGKPVRTPDRSFHVHAVKDGNNLEETAIRYDLQSAQDAADRCAGCIVPKKIFRQFP